MNVPKGISFPQHHKTREEAMSMDIRKSQKREVVMW